VEPQINFEQFKTEWLRDIEAGAPSTVELGHRFAHKLITQWLDIEDASDDLVYCDGTGDGGIDMAHLYRGDNGGEGENEATEIGHIWYLIQSKYGSAFRGTNTLLEESQKLIDTLDGRRQRLSSLAEGLLERLTMFRKQASDRDKIVIVFATVEPLTAPQRRTLDDVRAMGRSRLGGLFDVEAVSVETIYKRTLEEELLLAATYLKVPITTQVVESGEGLLVGSTSLISLYEFLKSYRAMTDDLDQLYEKNVRRFLGGRGKVNKAIQQTLRETPERFGLYNNGITIVVKDFAKGGDSILELADPFVVNGCQTTRTIWEVFNQRLEAGGTGTGPEMEDWRRRAGQGVVVTKIVKVGPDGETMLQAITRHTNSQNAVREKDFLALTSDFRSWKNEMGDLHVLYLEIQRGGWESQSAFQRQRPDTKQFTEHANAFDLLKVYGAGWLGEAGTAFGRNAAFLPNGSIFKKIMNREDSDEPFGVKDFYAAYRLSLAAEKFQFGRKASENSRRQTRFLFFMVVIELLRDVMIRAQLPATPSHTTNALLKLFSPGCEETVDVLLDAAIEVIDEYLTAGEEDSVFLEPSFINTFNNDLNGYLKSEQLGKTEESSPRFRALIGAHRRTMGRSSGGLPSPRERITIAIRG
jgi:hypothetical protein